MNRLYQFMKEKGYWTIFVTVFMVGVFVHGSRIFTAYYAFDDLNFMYEPGATYTSGRWFLQTLYDWEVKLMGSHINAKGYMGIVSFALMTLICCVIANQLELKSKLSLVLLSAVVVTYPYVTSLFSYTFTAGYYYFAILMSLVAAILVHGRVALWKKIIRTVVGMVLLGLSMAVYQVMLCPFVAFLTILAIHTSMEEQNESWKSFIPRCFWYLVGCVGGCLFYSKSNDYVLDSMGLQMTSYQGMNQAGIPSLEQFVERLGIAYKEYFYPSYEENFSYYNTQPIHWCYEFTIAVLVVCMVIFLARECRKKCYKKAIQLAILFVIIPAAVNSVFLTADLSTTNIYSLMMFAGVMTYICFIYMLERLNWEEILNFQVVAEGLKTGGVSSKLKKKDRNKTLVEVLRGSSDKKIKKGGCYLAIALLVYTIVYFGYTANICYTKAAIQQEQTIGYFNRLITKIQMTEGYTLDLPIAYINERSKNGENYTLRFFEQNYHRLAAYNNWNILNVYNWKWYMRVWCGFAHTVVSQEQLNGLMQLEEVQQMPAYPNEGSIKIVEGTIVVKFAN